MGMYRKKPVVVEAEQYVARGIFVRGMCQSPFCVEAGLDEPHVHTIHSNQAVRLEVGDFIIPEPDGEHYYPCKPDIFAATYEPAETERLPEIERLSAAIRLRDDQLDRAHQIIERMQRTELQWASTPSRVIDQAEIERLNDAARANLEAHTRS